MEIIAICNLILTLVHTVAFLIYTHHMMTR